MKPDSSTHEHDDHVREFLSNAAPALETWYDTDKTDGTANPIFLVQERYRTPSLECAHRHQAAMDADDARDVDPETVPSNAYRCSECDIHWRQRGVFLSRSEATAWATRNAHNLGAHWRVYTVPCHGELAELLMRAYRILNSDLAGPQRVVERGRS